MRNFENRKALAEVLDETHKKVVIETLGRVGIEIVSNSWHEIDDILQADNEAAYKKLDEDDMLSRVEYTGDDSFYYGALTPIGNLFGESYTLLTSGQTDYSGHISKESLLGDQKYERQIRLCPPNIDETFPDTTSLYVLRDIPPVVVRGQAIIDIIGERSDTDGTETVSDIEIIERAQKEYGTDGFTYVSEEMAGRVIAALRADVSRTFNISEFHGLKR